MNSAQPPISAARSAGVSRQTGTLMRRSRFSLSMSVHVVLIVLAGLIWWIARDMVSITSKLDDASRLRFVLSDDLKDQWRIVSETTMPVTLEVTGPTKRINDFAREMDANPGRYSFSYRITQADLPSSPAPRRQAAIRLNVDEIARRAEGSPPAELIIKPLAGDRVYEVVLEPFVTKLAFVDITGGVVGDVPGYGVSASVSADWQLQVHGPLSKVDAISTGPGGTARLTISPPLSVPEFVQSKANAERKTREEVLGTDSRHTTSARLAATEGVEIQRLRASEPGGDAQRVEPVTQIDVELHFKQQQTHVAMDESFPVSLWLPGWLAAKHPRPRGIDLEERIPVRLHILPAQRDRFNEQNVKLVIDMSSLTVDDFKIEGPDPETGLYTAQPLTNQFYSLRISPELSYRLPGENVTVDQYIEKAGIRFEWTD